MFTPDDIAIQFDYLSLSKLSAVYVMYEKLRMTRYVVLLYTSLSALVVPTVRGKISPIQTAI